MREECFGSKATIGGVTKVNLLSVSLREKHPFILFTNKVCHIGDDVSVGPFRVCHITDDVSVGPFKVLPHKC